MSNDLKINIIAQDGTGPGLSSVEQNLNSAEAAAGRLVDKIKAIKTTDAGAGSGLKSIADNAVAAQAATDKLASSMNKGMGTSLQNLQNMGRIIQDMPYGIQGIGNNIQPMVESFARAKEEAGSTSGAVKMLLSSIAGPAGLAMIGIPLLTSLAVAFGPDLIKAINSGAETVEQLKARLQGIQQYRDFDMTIRIAGLDGVAKLKAELDQLIAKKAFLEGAQAADAKVSAVGQWNIVSAMTNPLGYGLTMQRQNEARNQAELERTDFYKGTAQKIASGKRSLGDDENVRLMSKYLGMSESAAMKLNATNKTNWEIAEKKSQIDLAQTKESQKNAKTGDSEAAKAAREAEALRDAIYAANKALSDMGKDALPSIETATKQVEETTTLLKSAMAKGDKTEIQNQTRALTDQKAVLKQTTDFWESANKRYDLDLAKNTETTLSVADAQKGLADANTQVKAAIDAQDSKGYIAAINEKELAEVRVRKATEASTKSLKDMRAAFSAIGDVVTNLGGNGQSVTSMLSGFAMLSKGVDTTGMTAEQAAKAISANNASAYSQIGQSVGALIGGKTGQAITNTAALAGAGFAVGGPIGAGVGAVVGLVSSLFGGGASKQDISNAQNASASGWKSVDQLAASGSPIARAMMKRAGYSATNAAVNARESQFYGMGFDNLLGGTRDFGMFYTKENGYNADVIDYLTALEKVDSVIRSFASTAIAQKIDDLNWKYEELIGQQGELASIEQARIDELITTVTGISADSVATFISDAVSANVTGEAGAAFSAKFEESVATAIRSMAISNLVNQAIMPVLQPVMSSIVSGLISGTLTTDQMAGMMGSVKAVSAQIQPMVTSLAQAFDTAGVGSSSTTSISSIYNRSAFSSLFGYQMAAAGVPGFADGGYFGGGLRIVGERGPELEYTGPSRIVSSAQTRSMFDNSSLVAELKALREEVGAAQYAIARNTARTAQWIEKWERDGLPKETTA